MKNLIIFALFLGFTLSVSAQVGIGTSSPDPSSVLELSSTDKGFLIPRMTSAQRSAIVSPATGLMVFQTDGSPGFYFYDGSSWGQVGAGSGIWVSSGSDIYNSNVGNVGIGTGLPTYKLEVNGRVRSTGINETSDVRWKKDITTLTHVLAKVLEMRGVSYKWRTDEFPQKQFDKDTQIGLIAQEVEKYFPELVETDRDGFKSVEYSKLVAVLIEAIKELNGEIEQLKAENTVMKSDIQDIKASVEYLLKKDKTAQK